MEKCERKGFQKDIESIKSNIHDVAGIRIVTLYKDDIYRVRDALIGQPPIEGQVVDGNVRLLDEEKNENIVLLEEKDYVAKPKINGYRSLHLIVEVQVRFKETMETVPVEIQIRTKAMDLWASIEHDCRYKNACPSKDAEIFDELSRIVDNFDESAIKLRDNTKS
jgi:putative GTP pyrophosphokinase